ncbi:hypothetical protein SAMN05421753_107231 [Planctomicrobium piriforme]|uniref:Uncharacterized protein n=1 Tax=Planctomicrobium piriforme TaxID=1576369 RepID=A0A1I3H356_9PLAN|nr:hypothetical protein SAMN05421753_107231 [Planctomicrobium piriforme]
MKIKEAEAEISKSTIHTTLYGFGDKQVPREELPKEVQEEFRKALLPPETAPSTPPEPIR